MIEIPALSHALLGELAAEMGGYDFSEEPQRRFLSCVESCDVQAAPGNGKTSLLVAKLALLSRTWTSRTQGVCVISHTNAAREEVERKLATHPAGSLFLSYPHFIGTVTSFIDQFIALPYMRGLGWRVARIDDDVFRMVALSRFMKKPTLANTARARKEAMKHAVETWVSNLTLDPAFVCTGAGPLQRLKVRTLTRQPGAHTRSGLELEKLKAEMTNDGFFRFDDLTAIATKGLDECPHLAERLRIRFPLVLLDEAQDTTGPQFDLLHRVFGTGVAFQRLGDLNQSLYEDSNLGAAGASWQPKDAIPLDATRRFGSGIANFASRLTPRVQQTIVGILDAPEGRSLLLFDEATIGQVLSIYAEELQSHWGGAVPEGTDVWALASRHNPASARGRSWPKTIIDYHPSYRADTLRVKSQNFCTTMRKASLLLRRGDDPGEVASLIAAGVLGFLACYRNDEVSLEKPTVNSIWRFLEKIDDGRSTRVRRLVRDNILRGNATSDEAVWVGFCSELEATLAMSPAMRLRDASGFQAFEPESDQVSALHAEQGMSTTQARIGDLTIKLGSIHSMKGKTVDAVLILETEIHRGPANADKAMDISSVLPHAFGVSNINFAASKVLLSAATNIFVAATRPRRFLALAMRRSAADSALIEAASAHGWGVRDLTIPGT